MPGSIFQGDEEPQENPFAEFESVEGAQEEVTEVTYEDVGQEPTSEYTEDLIDSEISEAERRFNKAALYKQWISGSLFGGSEEPEVLEVETEFKEFARKQLRKLIGIETEVPVVESPFTPDEVLVLKKLAAQVLSNPKLNKTQEVPKPAPKKPPVLKPRPAPVKPPAPTLVPRTPKPAPQAPKPVQQVQKPKPVQQTKPPVTNRVPQKPAQPGKIPPNESVIQENGRTYKIYHVSATPSEFGPASKKIVNKLGPNQTAMLLNDIRVFKDADGNLFKIVKKDATPQAMPENRVPFPTDMQMDMVTARMSERAAHVAINRDYGRR